MTLAEFGRGEVRDTSAAELIQIKASRMLVDQQQSKTQNSTLIATENSIRK
jgi:hypothetical protein